ncbi:MAG: transporter substrate-binding domain-containing protein [Parvibaculaceae bacterium]
MGSFLKSLAAAGLLLALATGEARAEIKIGLASEPFPPFFVKDASGKWGGWEIDALNAVCKAMNETCDFVEVAWDGIIPALQAKNIDVIWAAMSINEDRRKVISFSDPYYATTLAVAGQKGSGASADYQSLKGKRVGVQVSTVSEKYAQKFYVPAGAEILTYQTQDEAHQDLVAGRVDAAIGSAGLILEFLRTDSGKSCCEFVASLPYDEILGDGVGAGLRKEDEALREKLNAGIKEAAESGELAKLAKNYPGLSDVIVIYPKK